MEISRAEASVTSLSQFPSYASNGLPNKGRKFSISSRGFLCGTLQNSTVWSGCWNPECAFLFSSCRGGALSSQTPARQQRPCSGHLLRGHSSLSSTRRTQVMAVVPSNNVERRAGLGQLFARPLGSDWNRGHQRRSPLGAARGAFPSAPEPWVSFLPVRSLNGCCCLRTRARAPRPLCICSSPSRSPGRLRPHSHLLPQAILGLLDFARNSLGWTIFLALLTQITR